MLLLFLLSPASDILSLSTASTKLATLTDRQSSYLA